MTVDSSAGMAKCDYMSEQKCNYTNTVDNSTFDLPCECAFNDVGSSWCPAYDLSSKLLF